MRAVIAAEPKRVWRALTEPSELVAWDDCILAAIDPAVDYPTAGRAMRWRYQLGSVQLVLHDRPREVVPYQRLHQSLSLSSMRYDQTFSLAAEPASPERPQLGTQLGVKVTASNSVPVLGGMVDRFEVRRLAVERTGKLMQSLQRWCEADLNE
jgi:hypothetical protein